MKKPLSLILALTLALALPVPAFAAEYGEVKYGDNIVFEQAYTVTKELKFPYEDFGTVSYETKTETVVMVKPGSTISFGTETSPRRYALLDSGAYDIIRGDDGMPAWYDVEGAITIEIILKGDAGSTPADMLSVVDFDADPSVVYIQIDGDASATPAQTTTPTTSTNEPTTTTTVPAQTAAPAGSRSYTAQKYDTYGKLAVNYYGSYAYTKSLQKANNNKTLKTGVAVTLPDTLGNAARLAPATAGAGEKLYTVLAGDTLGMIAKSYYGNSAQYKAIFERNADRLKNANTIYEGQVIVLPAK